MEKREFCCASQFTTNIIDHSSIVNLLCNQ